MSILETLRLAPKKDRGAPVIGEKKKKQEQTSTLLHNSYIRILIILGFLVILGFSVPQSSYQGPVNYSIGEPWRADDLTAPFTFPIKKDEKTIEQERRDIKASTPPIFHINHDAEIRFQGKIDSVFQRMQPVLDGYEQWQRARQNEDETARKDSLRFIQLKNASPLNLSSSSWNALLENYQQTEIVNQSVNTKTGPSYEFIGTYLKNHMEDVTWELLEDGIINTAKNQLSNDELIVRDLKEYTERTRNVANIRDISEARDYAQHHFSTYFHEDMSAVANQLFNQVIQPNIIYDQQETEASVNEALASISMSKGAVAQGQVIIRKGDIVTEQRFNMLQSLADARAQNATDLERWLRFGGD